MGFWKNAFAIDKEAEHHFSEEERALVRRLTAKIVDHGLALPGILFIETARPLNFIGSQALAYFEPMIEGLFSWEDYAKFRVILERRGSVELILKSIEDAEAKRSLRSSKASQALRNSGKGRLGRIAGVFRRFGVGKGPRKKP